jgi:S1-C subfamily serine protease
MMPYSVARADFGARYFVKVRARLGIFAEPVPDEERKRIQTNTGVLVRVVMEDTPAFNSDVMPGDIVLSVGGDPIQSVPSFYRSLDKYQGTRPRFLIDRGGVRIEKEIDVLPHNADATKK